MPYQSANYFVSQTYVDNNFVRPVSLINGGFNVWQRGTSMTSANITTFGGLTSDRWSLTLPGSQLVTASRINDFVTSNKRAHYAYSLALSSATVSLTAGTQFAFHQRMEGIYARDLLYKATAFSGKIKTNKAGTYTAFISWVDSASSNVVYCAAPVVLTGSGAEESFSVVFPPCPNTFTPVVGEAFSVKVGIVLAGNATTVTGIYLTEPAASETYCASGQVNLFDSASNYIQFSQFTLTPGSVSKPYFQELASVEEYLCKRYCERLTLSSHLVNLYAGTASHVGSLSYLQKFANPSLVFLQTDAAGSAIANSSNVFYGGGSTAFTLGSFAQAGRITTKNAGFTFTTTSTTPANISTGNLNLDVVVSAVL